MMDAFRLVARSLSTEESDLRTSHGFCFRITLNLVAMKMNPLQTYRQSHQKNWTRIDMLLTLYRETELSLRSGIDALRVADQVEFTLTQLRSIKLLLAIIDGIKPEYDDLSRNIYQLCLFIFHQVSRENIEGLQNGLRVLVTLKESFEAIENESRHLEAEGKIPPLDFDLDGTLAVG
ncbi:hypothetical protein Mal48_25730 [Thalassoglobus polymorphus]|uniref:Flagellar protein FliS n=2 Tax=Thalassoglobus polymorphus TaxID=2527994 RepID=A0A517QNU1_9PLAN|nr:hypothetical protein Mal48_25730 [Thalassoglobus polymorphus]